MNTLIIQQGSTLETVTPSIINKLYEVALSISEPLEGELDNAYLSGHIKTDVTYKSYVDYLAGVVGEGDSGIVTSVRLNPSGRFQNLRIDVTNGYAIPFEDPNMLLYLLNLGVGSDGLITTVLAAAAASNDSLNFINTTDTTITKFNELKYFTNITGSKGGYSGNSAGYIEFANWTALEEVDISNFTSIGHSGSYGNNDTFKGCTSLKTVTASNKLVNIGYDAFLNCSNLEDITDLSGTINIYRSAFENCTKLKSSNFDNCLIELVGTTDGSNFRKCTTLTSISLTGTSIPADAFRECSNLTTVNGLSDINTVYSNAFRQSSLSNVSILDLSNLQYIYNNAFNRSLILGELNLPNLRLIDNNAFNSCPISKVICLNKIDTVPTSCFLREANDDLLTEVYLPKECTAINLSAFKNRKNLTTIKQYTDSVDNWSTDPLTGEKIPGSYGDISNVTSIGNAAFSGCSSLTGGIDFTNVTSIDNDAFLDCTSFAVEINAPNLTTLGKGAFCKSGITRVTNLGSITSIRSATPTGTTWGCFEDCTNLTEITIPNTVTTIEAYAFANTTSLSTFNIDYSIITTIGHHVFMNIGCDLGVVNFENLTTIDNGNFYMSVMDALYLPKIVSPPNNGYYIHYMYNDGLFAGNLAKGSCCTIRGILYFRDIQKFYPGTFCAIKVDKIVINNSTPPTFCNYHDKTDLEVADAPQYQKNNVFAGTNIYGNSNLSVIGGIYVPDAAVSTYQSNSDWSPYASYIHPISDLSTVATKAAWDLLSEANKIDTLIQEYM